MESRSMGRHPDSATRLAPAVTEEVIVVGLDKNVEKRGKNVAEWGLDGFRILENAGKAGMHWVRLPERGYASAGAEKGPPLFVWVR
jgi:hypothetical protein